MPDGLAPLLAELVLGATGRARRAAQAIADGNGCLDGTNRAIQWKVLPQFAEGVSGVSMAPLETLHLRRELLRARGDTARRATKAVSGIAALEAAGVRALVFKGLASMAVLYRDAPSRTIHDADLLVMPQDVPQAVACLEANGFHREDGGTLAEYTQFVENSPGFAGNQAITLYTDGSEIDLHWELHGCGVKAEELLSRSRKERLHDQWIIVPDPVDALLLTIRHVVRENFAADMICRDLMDTKLRCEVLERDGELHSAMTRIVEAGVEVPALAVLGVLSSYDEGTPASRACRYLEGLVSPVSRASAARLVELFHYQMRHGALPKDVFYLVHSRPLRQIARGLGTSWSSYRRNMKVIEQKLEHEMNWTARIAMLARSIPNLRTMKLARALARVKYGTD
ncbi:nucleotidyltransferase family protein [Paludibaculum fermentans]|uniref:Nucleotidyltransferase family protein n=1 Tax=Paludibaculum fermentans TaxID=1473598 RepID=A0A7S7NPU6_PALFE|nr:nucleotidyltransferase family protein [Paludibaculum fermentans]QOY87567.1 nucleotidyltransferase family protein [Paludibaculum fermentans]